MARLDAFSAQIVKFVRQMPDEALLELVKEKLGVSGLAGRGRGAQVLSVSLRGAGKDKKPKRSTAAARARRPAPPSAERQSLLDNVERVVKANPGVSASDVARLASIPQTRAAAALKELKLAKRIFQGGDRRFARYAADLKTAEQASTAARRTAKGPIVRSRKRAGQHSAHTNTPAAARKRTRAAASPPAA